MKELIKIEKELPSTISLVTIETITSIDDYLFITFSNGKKILTNGTLYFDASSYQRVNNIFIINGNPHADFANASTHTIINLVNNEVLFHEYFVYYIIKSEHNLLTIIMQGNEKTKVYDIDTKQYIPIPKELANFKIDKILCNGLIVLEEDTPEYKAHHDTMRCVINKDGKLIIPPIKGGIYADSHYIFGTTKDSLTIIDTEKEQGESLTITKGKEVIMKPEFLTEDYLIILIYQTCIRIYDFSLSLLHEYPLENAENLVDSDTTGHVIKLCFKNGSSYYHEFINYLTGKRVKHNHIEGFEHWDPTVYVARDYAEGVTTEQYEYENNATIPDTTFTIYDADLNEKKKFRAKFCDAEFDPSFNLYRIITYEDGKRKRKVYIFNKNEIQDIDADYINSHANCAYSYGINQEEVITFYDAELNIVIPPFSLKEYKLKFRTEDFSYFIINGYLCMTHFSENGYGGDCVRCILRGPDGTTLIDAYDTRCYLIGDFIQIYKYGTLHTQFLDTTMGVIGKLKASLPNFDEKETQIMRFTLTENTQQRARKKPDSLKE